MPTDIININDLEVFANHGVFKEENVLGQKFLISVKLFINTREAGKSDNIEKSINYGDVCHFIGEYMQLNTFKLIETAAEKLSEEILLKFTKAEKIILEIKKPWAPIKMHIKDVTVKIERGWKKAHIAFGSNLGNKKAHIENGLKKISDSKYCKIEKISDFIITEPVSDIKQDDFLNGCTEIKTLFTPYELLNFLNTIEAEEGRERTLHWGPRTLDLDIIFYDNIILNTETLTIPHIEAANREFVLKPLCQISPFEKHPVFNKSVLELYNDIQNRK